MNVSIVIPNYNGEKYIIDCIASIYDQVNNKRNIIVVDNRSTDSSVALIKSRYPEIRIIENNKNLGFAAAVNQGIRASESEYVILLNNDAFARDGFVQALVECVEKDSNIFSAGAKMLRYSEPGIIDNAGDELTVLGWAYKCGDGRPSEEFNKERRIFSACAGAAIYRRKIFEEIGYFDESFFAYLEDVDIGFRANLHGYKNLFCPTAEVEHIGSATSGSKYNDFKVRISARNNVWLLIKNFPLAMTIVNLLFYTTGIGVKAIFFTAKGYGKSYRIGIKEGINSLKTVRTNLSKSRFPTRNIIRVEYMMAKSLLEYIAVKLNSKYR
jgi:GT2 family glycosyltransferase